MPTTTERQARIAQLTADIARVEGWQADQVAKYGRRAPHHDEELAVLDAELRELTRGTHGPRCACGAGFLEPPGDTMLQCDWCTKTVPVESA